MQSELASVNVFTRTVKKLNKQMILSFIMHTAFNREALRSNHDVQSHCIIKQLYLNVLIITWNLINANVNGIPQ